MDLVSRITEVITAIGVAIKGKQDNLVSGTNIKTINSQSLLGSGNIVAIEVFKNPIMTYTDLLLTRIDYDDSKYKVFTYTDGVLSTLTINGKILKTYNYTDGVLTSIVESEI